MQQRFTEAKKILERIAKTNGQEKAFMFEEQDFKSFSTFNTSKVALTIYNENTVR